MTTATKDTTELPSVFGFRVRTAVSLQFLRHGGGIQLLEIVPDEEAGENPAGELLGQWPLQGTEYPAHARLSRVPNGYEYWTSDTGLFRIDLAHGRIAVPATSDALLLEQRLHGMPMILSFLERGDVSLHAAAVEIGNEAVVLAAPSRYGKTTLAFACQRAGHRVLSEDLICCRPESTEAIPGPALLRIRPDVFDGTVPDGLEIVARRADRILFRFDDNARGSGGAVRLKAIVFLREADEVRIEPVAPQLALKDLWRLSFRTGTESGRADSFRNIARLAGAVPSYNLFRPLSLAALDSAIDAIETL